MIGPFIEGLLGSAGRAVLYFYRDNSLAINLIVLLYGLIIYASWMNLVRIYRYLIVEMAKEAHLSEELNRKKSNKKIRDIIGVPWERAVKASPFPFIARMGGLIPRQKTVENIKFYLDEKDLAEQVLRALQGEKIQHMSPSYKKLAQKELDERKAKLTNKK